MRGRVLTAQGRADAAVQAFTAAADDPGRPGGKLERSMSHNGSFASVECVMRAWRPLKRRVGGGSRARAEAAMYGMALLEAMAMRDLLLAPPPAAVGARQGETRPGGTRGLT